MKLLQIYDELYNLDQLVRIAEIDDGPQLVPEGAPEPPREFLLTFSGGIEIRIDAEMHANLMNLRNFEIIPL